MSRSRKPTAGDQLDKESSQLAPKVQEGSETQSASLIRQGAQPPGSSARPVVLDIRHVIVINKLEDDFALSCLDNNIRHHHAEKASRERGKLLIKESGLHHESFANTKYWTFPPILPAVLLVSAEEEAVKKMQAAASQCWDSLQSDLKGRPKLVVNFDCLNVGCIATILSLAVNRQLAIRIDHKFTHATEQVYHVKRNADADVLITVDGASLLAGAPDYPIFLPVHREKQYRVAYQPDKVRGRRASDLLFIGEGSMEEQAIFTAEKSPVRLSKLADFQEFRDELGRELQPGKQFIVPSSILGHFEDGPSSQLVVQDTYENFVSISFHSQWFREGVLAPSMQEFLRLFILEWNYLKLRLDKAEELLFRDHPNAGYAAHDLLSQLQLWHETALLVSSSRPDTGRTAVANNLSESPLHLSGLNHGQLTVSKQTKARLALVKLLLKKPPGAEVGYRTLAEDIRRSDGAVRSDFMWLEKYFGAILKKSPPGSGLPSTIRPDALPRLEKALAHLEAQDKLFSP